MGNSGAGGDGNASLLSVNVLAVMILLWYYSRFVNGLRNVCCGGILTSISSGDGGSDDAASTNLRILKDIVVMVIGMV